MNCILLDFYHSSLQNKMYGCHQVRELTGVSDSGEITKGLHLSWMDIFFFTFWAWVTAIAFSDISVKACSSKTGAFGRNSTKSPFLITVMILLWIGCMPSPINTSPSLGFPFLLGLGDNLTLLLCLSRCSQGTQAHLKGHSTYWKVSGVFCTYSGEKGVNYHNQLSLLSTCAALCSILLCKTPTMDLKCLRFFSFVIILLICIWKFCLSTKNIVNYFIY